VASRHGHEGLAAIGHHLASHVRQMRGDYRGALEALRRLSQREQQARAESLKTRVDVIEWQLELRQNRQRVRRLESDSRLYERLAMEDSLTGLANRRRVEAAIARELEGLREEDTPWCLALLDVDRFKQVNDRFSHNVGDAVLKALAEILRGCLRDKDLPARLAGDEFVLLLKEVDEAGAQHICRRIDAAVQAHDWNGLAQGLQASVSIGLAQASPGDTPAALMLRSDQDMYRRKQHAAGA
jgi:diguanylate cyclase (GGDEF)-like protein